MIDAKVREEEFRKEMRALLEKYNMTIDVLDDGIEFFSYDYANSFFINCSCHVEAEDFLTQV